MAKITVLFILFFLYIHCSFCEKYVTVETSNGAVSGKVVTASSGRRLEIFLGIPYAKPPVGKLRFKEALPVENWLNVRPSHQWSPKCIQYFDEAVIGEEDCLYLNIFTPKASNISQFEVIFFIHGGAFMFGSGADEPRDSLIANKFDNADIVYVSINYRLGPFGFLTTEDGVIPGNIGLKDQVLALKWVQKNIEFFGGNKRKVTIAGHSAGGASVHYHYLSPLSKELFIKGISASGSALCPGALQEKPKLKAKMLATALNCPSTDSQQLLECLLVQSPQNITLKIRELFMPWVGNPFSPLGPVIEPESSSAFISEHPYYLLAQGKFKDAPWLVGLTTEEGLYPAASFITNDTLLQELNDNWNKIAPHLLDYNFTVPYDKVNEVSNKIKKHYLEDNLFSKNQTRGLVKMLSDRMFDVSVERAVRLQAAASKSNVFLYRFAYRGQYSLSNSMCKCMDILGVSHADDITYLLNMPWANSLSKDDLEMEKTMITIWKSFAIFGIPKQTTSTGFWYPVSPDSARNENLNHMILYSGNNITLSSSGTLSHIKFWSELPIQEL